MQGGIPLYADGGYAGAGLPFAPPVPNPRVELPTHAMLAPPAPGADVPHATDTEARGLLAMVQLPVGSSTPTQSAWCSVSNLVAVAFAPRHQQQHQQHPPVSGGGASSSCSTAAILVLEPSNPEDVTALEVPLAGPGDYITSLEWSWPGQRRALLSATASGRVVVWTQPSQQGQDDLVFPRSIDDWHGQLLLDVGSGSGGGGGGYVMGGGGGSSNSLEQLQLPQQPQPQPHVKQEHGAPRPVGIKHEPGATPEAADAVSDIATAAAAAAAAASTAAAGPAAAAWPALAGACWLRQPAGGRCWSTSSLAMKRLDAGPLGTLGPGSDAGPAGGGGPQENFDSLFTDDTPAPGAVPHWARPHQLTAAVMTSSGKVIVLWALASKLSNTLSWHRSKSVQVPSPGAAAEADAAAGGGGDAAAAAAAETAAVWRVAAATMVASVDGGMLAAVVYGRRREAAYLYCMRGNPTLGGQPVAATPGAPGATATSTSAVGRDAPLPTVALQASLPMPSGLAALRCRLHVPGSGGGAKHAYVLAAPIPSPAHPPAAHPHLAAAAPPGPGAAAATVICFGEAATQAATSPPDGAAAAVNAWRAERQWSGAGSGAPGSDGINISSNGNGGSSSSAASGSSAGSSSSSCSLCLSLDGSKLVVGCGRAVYALDAETMAVLAAHDLAQPEDGALDGTGPGPSPYANGFAPHAAASPGGMPTPSARPRAPAVLSAAACISANSCCICTVALLRPPPLDAADADAAGADLLGDVEMPDTASAAAAASGGRVPGDAAADLTVVVGERRFAVHRDVMTPRCGYFRGQSLPGAWGGGGGGGAGGGEVPLGLTGADPEAFELALCWVYTGAVTVPASLAAAVAAVADHLMLPELCRVAAAAMGGSRGDGGSGGGGGDGDDEDEDEDDGAAVVLCIRTVPDVLPPPPGSAAAAAGSPNVHSMEDVMACNMDTMRLAWGVMHRLSIWDVAERLRCTWLARRRGHVSRSLAQLDGLLYAQEEAGYRSTLANGVSRAKLEVLRRIPHPRAALVAADLLAWARMIQYSQTLTVLYSQQAEALQHPETRVMAAHMVWFVLEVLTLMMSGLKLFCEAAEAKQAADGGAPGTASDVFPCSLDDDTGGDGTGVDCLPLIRLYPDYHLHKHMQLVLLGTSGGGQAGKPSSVGLGLHPTLTELLGGAEATQRVRALLSASANMHKSATRVLTGHMAALLQQQQAGAAPGSPPPPGLVPVAGSIPLTPADVELAKLGDMPRGLMHPTLQSLFPGPFHVHTARAKGLFTPATLAQSFRVDELARVLPLMSLPREAIMERYRQLGLQQQLVDPRTAPAGAARRLAMSFRAPAPPPELHSHVLTQHVSTRQRQRWRRQRGAALALGSSAPLWSHAQGVRLDCLTGAPLPPGTSWSLEGAAAVGAVTAQMGPGVGAAGQRRNLPPLLAAVQRAWVCCAPPAELGSQWKRARLGLEQDLEY